MEEMFMITPKGMAVLLEVEAQEARLGRRLTEDEAEVLLDRYSRTLTLLEGVLG